MLKETVHAFRMPVSASSAEDQGFRHFTVTDPLAVALPGCLAITELRLDGHTMPVAETHKVPTDSTHQNFKELELPNYQLTEGPGGVPILLRGLNSNDGKWQVGATLAVKGEWKDDKKKVVTPPPASKAFTKKELEALSEGELKELVVESKLDASKITNASMAIAAILEAQK